MGRMPEAEWWGPIPRSNYSKGRSVPVLGMVVHHIDGPLNAADGEFKRDGSKKSAHFGVDFDGSVVQWVDTDDVAYASCNSNWTGYISVENASVHGAPDDPMTDAQVAANARIAVWAGIEARTVDQMGGPGIGYHRQFPGPCSTHWGISDCPGDGIVAQIPAIVAAIEGDIPMTTDELAALLGQWEQDTRAVVTKTILDTLGQWEQDTRAQIIAHVDKRFDELEKKLG